MKAKSSSVLLPQRVRIDSTKGVVWERLGEINVDAIGKVLAFHLIVEHYLEKYIEALTNSKLCLGAGRLNFSQKVDLLSGPDGLLNHLHLLEGIRALSAIRNKMSHRLSFELGWDDVKPLCDALKKLEAEGKKMRTHESPLDVVETFAHFACICLAGGIYGTDGENRKRRVKS